jgi:hypothetical protein
MSTEIATVISPRTGEVISLDAPDQDLGGFLNDVRDLESAIRESKRAVHDELLRRMDSAATWTVHVPGLKLSGPSPAPTEEFDELELRTALLTLVDEGVISVEAVDRAIEPVVTYKARRAGINALRKLGGRVAETVTAHARSVEKTRYVKVERL